MQKIIITGPESTGKSTLTEQLADHYCIPFVPEYARIYIAALDRSYTKEDLNAIAKGQIALSDEIAQLNPKILLCDTDLLTIKIWYEDKFDHCPLWISEYLKSHLPDLYLLCKNDLQWQSDPQREDPDRGEELMAKYLGTLETFSVNYRIVEGFGMSRTKNAQCLIEELH